MILSIITIFFGLAMGLIIPGFLLALLLFRKFKKMDKISIGIGLSLCIDIILGFILKANQIRTFTGGITASNLWLYLSVISIFFSILLFLQNKKRIKLFPKKALTKKTIILITQIFLLMLFIFLTRFFLYINNPFAGDSYEFKSLYAVNQIIHNGYINDKVPLNDLPYKFYTGMLVDDTLHNEGHPVFLAELVLLTGMQIETLRRLAITTLLLVLPLFSLYRLLTTSGKFGFVYVLLSLLYFESIMVISGKTANITLAWYLQLSAIFLISQNNYKIRSYISVSIIQLILFLTYKTEAISLIPVLISIIYGKSLINLKKYKNKLNLSGFLKSSLSELFFINSIIISFTLYYFYSYPLIVKIFLEKIISPVSEELLKDISILFAVSTILINILIFIFIYFISSLINKKNQGLIKSIKKVNFNLIRRVLFIIFILLLCSITIIYIRAIKQDNTYLISPSTHIQLIKRIFDLFLFYGILGTSILYYDKFLTKKINKLIYCWMIGSLIILPIWLIWGGVYGLVLRSIATLLFSGTLIVTISIERFSKPVLKHKIFLIMLIIYLISPTLYYMKTINLLAKGAIDYGEYRGLKWVSANINKNNTIYSDLRIAGALLPISDYTHILLKGPNDFGGYNNFYECVHFNKELENAWYTNKITPDTNKIFTYRNIDYIIQSSTYYNEGIMASNFYYKPMDLVTKKAYDKSIFFDKVYSNGKLWIYNTGLKSSNSPKSSTNNKDTCI